MINTNEKKLWKEKENEAEYFDIKFQTSFLMI